MTRHSETSNHLVIEEDWDLISSRMIAFQIEFEEDTVETQKLKRYLGAIKQSMHHNIENLRKDGTVDAAFLVGAIKTIEKTEKIFEKQNIRKTDFLLLLRLILDKLKKERLITSKPMEKQMEFKKLKGATENDRVIRKTNQNKH